MTPLKTGALAVTLIIIIPILLGYGMASETTTETYDREVSSVNMSDLILNTETNYYGKYTGASNNSMLIQDLVSSSRTWSQYAVPDYLSISSNNSSFPNYSKTTGTFQLTSSTSSTVTLYADGDVLYFGGEVEGNDYNYTEDYVKVTLSDYPVTLYPEDAESVRFDYGTIEVLKIGETYTIYYYDYDPDDREAVASHVSTASIRSTVDENPVTVTTRDPTSLPSNFVYSLNVGDEIGMIYLDSYGIYGAWGYLNVLGNTIYASGERFRFTESAEILVLDDSVTSLSYTYGTAVENSYADPSLGWMIPTPSITLNTGESVNTYWSNAAENGSVTFDIYFADSGAISFSAYDTVNDLIRAVTLTYSSGMLTYTGTDSSSVPIGSYRYVRLDLNLAEGKIVIYGLKDWSPLGETPTSYYTYTEQLLMSNSQIYRGEFSVVQITDSSGVGHFRVASANTVAGQYPTTKNFTFTPMKFYPDSTHFELYFNSVGIYGTGLSVCGNVDTTSPLHKSIVMDLEDGVWTVTSYNGDTYTVTYSPTIVFQGEWSVSITGTFYEEDTREVSNWVAGEFAFDEDDFILAMIITSVAVFVALGLMKGVKIGVLLVVCSAAGIIAFIIA